MTTTAVGSVPQTSQVTQDRGLTSLKSEDFFELLVTELQQQDPFEPTKTEDMIGQVSQIRSIELSANLTDVLSDFSEQQRTNGVADLLGKFVVAEQADASGNVSEVGGIVTGVRFASDGTAVLELDTGHTVKAEHVTQVTAPEFMDEAALAASSGATANAAGDDDEAGAAAADKSGQQSKKLNLLPWLSLDGLKW